MLFVGPALVMVAALSLASCNGEHKLKERIAEDVAALRGVRELAPVPVRTIRVECTESASTLNFVGRVEPAKSAVVMNRFPGTVNRLCVRTGRRISRGETIAEISSESVQSAYDIAKSTLDQAEDAWSRVSKVYESGSITDLKMVDVRTQLEKARTAEKSARKALEECTLTAPFSGIVGDVYIHEGEHAAAAAPVVQIVDVQGVEVHFSLPENEYSSVSVSDRVSIEVPALSMTFEGSIAVKGVTASALSHSYDCTVKGIRGADQLMPGMVCKVRVVTGGEKSVVVPSSAVMTDFEGRYVWGVDPEDRVVKRYVNPAGYAGKGIVIGSGLEEGDRVIVEGSRKVSTGMKVCEK